MLIIFLCLSLSCKKLLSKKKKKRLNMLLFSILLFPVMESSTTAVSDQGSRIQTPTQDEDAAMKPFQALSIEVNEELRSDLVDNSIFDKRGILIQFLNSNCTGSPHVFGGMRLSISDINKVPAYLSKYRRLIKQHAVHALMQHFKEMQCGVGAAEELCTDDFGMTFTVATVTGHGALLNPGKRQEGPLFFCHFPALVDPVILTHADWGTRTEGESVHVINCYISLPPPQLRRSVVIKKYLSDQAASVANCKAALALSGGTVTTTPGTSSATPAKKVKMGTQTTPYARPYVPYVPNMTRDEIRTERKNSVGRELDDLRNQVRNLKGQLLPTPPLPIVRPPVWPSKNPCPVLPDE